MGWNLTWRVDGGLVRGGKWRGRVIAGCFEDVPQTEQLERSNRKKDFLNVEINKYLIH